MEVNRGTTVAMRVSQSSPGTVRGWVDCIPAPCTLQMDVSRSLTSEGVP